MSDGPGVSNEITGGIYFHAVIQGRDITVVLPPEVTPALAGLPPASPSFVGREDEVDRLLDTLRPSSPALVTSVAGLGGIGKTELVIQAARRALRQPGWFPGGVLFVNLQGYDPELAVSAEDAISGLLRSLGIHGETIPDALQDKSRLFRSVLSAYADQGRRILLVIDNASTEDQVIPLLPGDDRTATLVTSRHTLDLGGRLQDLAVLDAPTSVSLLREVLHQARGPADLRTERDPAAALEIADLCAGLPLALRIAGALLADTPTQPLPDFADSLRAEDTRLDRLTREDRAVRRTLQLSYRKLGDEHARAFRLLSLNPGPDVSTTSVAHLLDTEVARAGRILEDLARAHLLDAAAVWGRWQMHDLVRIFAGEAGRDHADSDDRERARGRLFDHYTSTAEAAATTSGVFADRRAAEAWLEAELDNLLAVINSALPTGDTTTAKKLPFALARHLGARRRHDQLISITAVALEAGLRTHDPAAEGGALGIMGVALASTRRFREAIPRQEQAAEIFRRLGDVRGEAVAKGNLGVALRNVGSFDRAIAAQAHSGRLFEQLGDPRGQARALTNMGASLCDAGRPFEAIAAFNRAVRLFASTADQPGERKALDGLGSALVAVGRLDDAVDAHRRALRVSADSNDAIDDAETTSNLAWALVVAGRFDEAVTLFGETTAVFRAADDPYRLSRALNGLGDALRRSGRIDDAIAVHQEQLAIGLSLADSGVQASASSGLGIALQAAGRFDEAASAYEPAVRIHRESGDLRNLGAALADLSAALKWAGRVGAARRRMGQAVKAFTDVGDRDSATRARALLSQAYDVPRPAGRRSSRVIIFSP